MSELSKKIHMKFLTSKFTVLFIGLVLLILVAPTIADYFWVRWFVSMSIILIIIAAIYALQATMHNVKMFIVLAAVASTIQIISSFVVTPFWLILDHAVIAVFLASAVVAIYYDMVASKKIDFDTMIGAVCMYVMIAYFYGELYNLIMTIQPGAFAHELTSLANVPVSGFDLHYFSLITLTTVGFGDVVPLTGLARSVVMLESITGIFFLAILVARMVSMRE